MPRRPSSFAKALQDAEKRLEKALVEKKKAQSKLYELDMEIPSLYKTIAVLKGHFEPVQLIGDVYPVTTSVSGSTVPPDLAKLAGPQDLSGMGSIPAKQLSEDELLPDPEGDALTEE